MEMNCAVLFRPVAPVHLLARPSVPLYRPSRQVMDVAVEPIGRNIAYPR